MTDLQAIRNTIAGFLDRDALGAPSWATPRDGAEQLLSLLQPHLAQRPSIDLERALPSYVRHESGLNAKSPPAETGSGATPVTLAECPIGLFKHARGGLCLKTEYGNNEGRIDAYIVSTGEFFWGDPPQTIANQRAQMVTPVRHPDTTPAASGQAVAQEPVAWRWRHSNDGGWLHADQLPRFAEWAKPEEVQPLYTHPDPSAASVRAEGLEIPLLNACRALERFACATSDRGLCNLAWADALNAARALDDHRALQTRHASREGA